MKCPNCGEFIAVHTRTGDHATSEAAADKMRITAKNIRGKILLFFKSRGEPMIDEEVLALRKPNQSESSIRGRRTDLYQMGLLEDTGKTKLNSRGNASILWGLTLAGLMEANRLSP